MQIFMLSEGGRELAMGHLSLSSGVVELVLGGPVEARLDA